MTSCTRYEGICSANQGNDGHILLLWNYFMIKELEIPMYQYNSMPITQLFLASTFQSKHVPCICKHTFAINLYVSHNTILRFVYFQCLQQVTLLR